MTKATEQAVIEQGIYPEMSEADYRSADAVSQSDLKAWVAAICRRKPFGLSPRELMKRGCVHDWLLRPSECKDLYFTLPEGLDLRKSEDLAMAQDLEAQNQKRGIKPEEKKEIANLVKAVKDTPEVMRIIKAAQRIEVPCFAQIVPPMEVMSKALLDIETKGAIFDLKTTYVQGPDQFERSIEDFGYDIQAAYYEDVFAVASGNRKPFFGWIVVSTKNLNCWFHPCTAEHKRFGARWYQDMLPIVAKGLMMETAGT